MMDEILDASWNADHARFSADLDRGFAQLGAALKPLFARRPRAARPKRPLVRPRANRVSTGGAGPAPSADAS